jgi:DNA-binding MarR family transcriptional regulator
MRGLTFLQFDVLTLLNKKSRTGKELTDEIKLEGPALYQLMGRMIKAKWVRKSERLKDNSRLYVLTRKGQEIWFKGTQECLRILSHRSD